MRFHTLYSYRGQRIDERDFLAALTRVGVKKGDTIFVHSAISVFGTFGNLSRDAHLSALTALLKKSVGKSGTIIMPTFTYSFCKKEIFDITKSPSTVGALTEHFRHERGVVRTAHPIFSTAMWGKESKALARVSQDSFGEGSIFDTLMKRNGKIIFLGAPLQSITFLHYMEQKHRVPYRYIKTFRGTIVDGKRRYKSACTYFVRDLKRNVETEHSKFGKHMRARGVLKEAHVGGGSVLAIPARTCFKEGMRMLDRDSRAFLNR